MSAKTWFITGTSRGFGRERALAPLDIAVADYDSRLATWKRWQSLSIAAHVG